MHASMCKSWIAFPHVKMQAKGSNLYSIPQDWKLECTDYSVANMAIYLIPAKKVALKVFWVLFMAVYTRGGSKIGQDQAYVRHFP